MNLREQGISIAMLENDIGKDFTVDAILNWIRTNNWEIAIHVDYPKNGQTWTYYLLIHPNGMYIKTEERTDFNALILAWNEIKTRELNKPTLIGSTINCLYTNHRGETALRNIKVTEIYFGSTTWHPEEQYLMRGIDLDKNSERIFAMRDMQHVIHIK
jgi:hypothetical protein